MQLWSRTSLKLAGSPLHYPSHMTLHSIPTDALEFHTPPVTPHPSHLPSSYSISLLTPTHDIYTWYPLFKFCGISSFPTELGTDPSGQHFRPWFPDSTPTHTSTGRQAGCRCSGHFPHTVLHIAQPPIPISLKSYPPDLCHRNLSKGQGLHLPRSVSWPLTWSDSFIPISPHQDTL